MTAPSPEDSSTDVSDSSTEVSDNADITGTTTAAKEAISPLKRSAEAPSPSPPAKRSKPSGDVDSTPAPRHGSSHVLDFLRSRPQIATMNALSGTTQTETTSNIAAFPQAASERPEQPKPAQAVLSHVPVHGDAALFAAMLLDPEQMVESSRWQKHETILEFLRRLPVADPATARVGPWLWVQCPRELQDWSQEDDVDAFVEAAEPLLGALTQQRAIIEQQNPGKAVGTITRKLGPYRVQLEVDLLNAATKHGLTSGKWMLFPKLDDLPRVWRQVAEATAEGKLGPTSKVATWEPDNLAKGTLICVYTKDFSELADVKRVLDTLNDLNIVNKGTAIYYKCDAYTHLGIFSDNEYKLKASLYGSEEVRNDSVKYKDGVITRLKVKKKGAMDSFLNS